MTHGKRIFVFGLVALVTVPVVYILTHPGAGEPLTEERLAAAEALWKEKGPKSYALDIDVRGLHHHLEVKDGKVVSMTTDGKDADKRFYDYWSVEGMFQQLSEELSNLQHPETFGVTDPSEVTLLAKFDPRTGYPARFLRHVESQTRSVEWTAKLTVK